MDLREIFETNPRLAEELRRSGVAGQLRDLIRQVDRLGGEAVEFSADNDLPDASRTVVVNADTVGLNNYPYEGIDALLPRPSIDDYLAALGILEATDSSNAA